ncbi:MAG TPA: DUF1552 domain-containing protein [Polyangiaceae bacterium]|nr:DUF1552 domain-containing protein [Polyangiaceae bacterium]
MHLYDPTRVSRRRWLRGIGGLTLGLPFLDALAPRTAAARAAGVVRRFGVFFCCNGVEMSRWFPQGPYGALGESHLTGTANEALIPWRHKLLIPRGLHMAPRGSGRDPGGGDDHGRCMAHKLTAFPADANGLAQGVSIDYVLAQAINPGPPGARRPPLNLWVGKPGNYKMLDYISYSAPGRAVAGINNPWDAYAALMGIAGNDAGSAEARARILEERKSVLDLVQGRLERLRRLPLSQDDRQKLDMHFTAVREVEIEASATGVSCSDAGLEARASAYRGKPDLIVENDQYPVIADIQVDLFALALACDMTRVVTLHFDRGSGGPTFKWDGMNHEYNHHKLSHGKVRDDCFGESTAKGCDNVAGFRDMLFDIDRWHQRRFARLLERLDAYVEADGRTVLDNSAILYTNEMSDGKLHSFMDLPYIIAGSAGGRFRQNLYYPLGPEGDTDRSAPHNRLLNTIVNVMGVESDWFGLPEGKGGPTMQGGVYTALLA